MNLPRLLLKLRRKTSCQKLFIHSSCNTNSETHFGFQRVSESEKEEKVYAVFENVAKKYDVMNDSMSLGVHRLWKDYFIDRMAPLHGTKLIDVAGGTGDIALRYLKYLGNEHQKRGSNFTASTSQDRSSFDIDIPDDIIGPLYGGINEQSDESQSDSTTRDRLTAESKRVDVMSHVTVCDINQAMLDVGKQRAESYGYLEGHGISWVKGNAECLPVADNSFDVYSIAFGIRNCTHIDKVLTEAYRVLKPGGRFMCLEFSQVKNSVLSRLYDEYSFQVIPVMGQVIAGDWNSYQYLVESIRNFPDQETFVDMIKNAGFHAVTYDNLMFGVSAIHSGFKL